MTRVDFYVLGAHTQGDRFNFACRLADKIYQQGRRVHLQASTDAEARHLDRLLWTFRQGSFVPHGLQAETDPVVTPVLIGHTDQAGEECDVLINLSADIPGFFSRFERVAEVIDQDPQIRSAGRERFRCYRDRGYPLTSHAID